MADATPTPADARAIRMNELLGRYAEAIGELPWIAERLSEGQQFNAYASAADDEDCPDEDRTMLVGIGPISGFRRITSVEGGAEGRLIETALKIAALTAEIAEGATGAGNARVGELREALKPFALSVLADPTTNSGWRFGYVTTFEHQRSAHIAYFGRPTAQEDILGASPPATPVGAIAEGRE